MIRRWGSDSVALVDRWAEVGGSKPAVALVTHAPSQAETSVALARRPGLSACRRLPGVDPRFPFFKFLCRGSPPITPPRGIKVAPRGEGVDTYQTCTTCAMIRIERDNLCHCSTQWTMAHSVNRDTLCHDTCQRPCTCAMIHLDVSMYHARYGAAHTPNGFRVTHVIQPRVLL